MLDSIFLMIRSFIVLIFGLAVTLLFAGVGVKRGSKIAVSLFFTLLLSTQILYWQLFGYQNTIQMYPIITHIPIIIFICLYFKRSCLIATSSVLTAYLCCQIPRWIGSITGAVFSNAMANHIGYLISMCIVYYHLKKYVAISVTQLLERSTKSCLTFTAVPLLYYVFDYATTVYTDLLYTGAREVVQFTPSVICTFYLLFVLLYYNESQKQANAQKERDIFSSQLQQAKIELNTMRQMQNSTMIYRHDMRHHLSLIGGFAADGDLEKIKEYLAITESDIDALTPKRFCENETINLILSNFETRARKKRVVLQCDVILPKELGINETELCALLSNALENAIMAASQVEDETLRKVYIHAIVNQNRLVISTENAYVGQLLMDGELPKSSQKGPRHGYGIKSITTIVERHGGLYSFETDGGIFILRLLLPLNKFDSKPDSNGRE